MYLPYCHTFMYTLLSTLQHLIQSRTPLTRLQITHTLTPAALQAAVLDRVVQLERRAGQKLSGKKSSTLAISQKCVFYLDDLHLARGYDSGDGLLSAKSSSPLIEAVRYAASQGSLPDYSRNYQHDLHNIRYIASCTPSGFSRVSSRLARTFHPVPFLPPSAECLQQIFSRNVLIWLQQFPESATGETELLAEVPMLCTDALTPCCLSVYVLCCGNLYIFDNPPIVCFPRLLEQPQSQCFKVSLATFIQLPPSLSFRSPSTTSSMCTTAYCCWLRTPRPRPNLSSASSIEGASLVQCRAAAAEEPRRLGNRREAEVS